MHRAETFFLDCMGRAAGLPALRRRSSEERIVGLRCRAFVFCGEGCSGALDDFVGGAHCLYRDKEILVAVEIDQWGGGVVVSGQADLDRIGAVVFALEERGVAVVADVFVSWRLVGDVENGPALGAGAASAEAGDDYRKWEFIVDYGVEREIFFLKEIVERFGLA